MNTAGTQGTIAMFAKTIASGKVLCNHGTCQGGCPLNPLRCTPPFGGTSLGASRRLDVGNAHSKSLRRTYGKTGQI